MHGRPNRSIRRGAILAVTMACLLVVGLLAGSMLRELVIHHRRAEQRQLQLQAFWVCESALSRAVAQATAARDYRGEIWEIEADNLSGRRSALAKIQVDTVPGDPNLRHLIVETEYPRDVDVRAVYRREIELTLPSTGDTP